MIFFGIAVSIFVGFAVGCAVFFSLERWVCRERAPIFVPVTLYQLSPSPEPAELQKYCENDK